MYAYKVGMKLEEEAFAYLNSILETEIEQMEIVEEDTEMDIAGPPF